jgi:hypothetical protein
LYNKSTLKTKFNDQVAALDRLRQEKDALEKSLRQENETLQRSLDAKKAQLHESQKEASRLKLQASRAALAAKADAIVQARLDDDEDGIEVDEETSLTFEGCLKFIADHIKEFYKEDSERHKGEQLLATITSLLGTLERGKDKNGGLRGKRSGKFPASIMSYCFWMLNRLGKPKYINWQKLHPEYPVYSTVSNYTTEFRVPQV